MTRADQRKHHYIYKITRIDGSGKYYIGMHSTDSLDDGYFGSGKIITASIKRHGKEKHSKEILEFLPSRKSLDLREKEMVTEELIGDPLCMNLVPGGSGGNGGSEIGRRGAEALKRRRQDPEFEKTYQAAMLEAGSKFRNRRLSDSAFQNKLVKANKLAAQQKKAKREADPEYDRLMHEKLSTMNRGRKDSPETRAIKRLAQQKVSAENPGMRAAAAAKARAALEEKMKDEVLAADIKRRQSEGAIRLANALAADPERRAEIVEKKRQTRLQNGTNVMSEEARAKISSGNTGKKRSPDVIARAKLRTGELTTGFSTVWMNLNGLRRRVKKCDTLRFEQQGFSYGR